MSGYTRVQIETYKGEKINYSEEKGVFYTTGPDREATTLKEIKTNIDKDIKKEFVRETIFFRHYRGDIEKGEITSILGGYARITAEDGTKSKEHESAIYKHSKANIRLVKEIAALEAKIKENEKEISQKKGQLEFYKKGEMEYKYGN